MATENHHFWEVSPEKWISLSQAKREKFPSPYTPYWCIQNCHRKPPLFRSEHSKPWIVTLSLSWAKREKFPSLHTPYWCIQNCHRKPPLLRGEHSEPWIVTPSLSSEAREISLNTYPLLVHSKLPQKTTTFERQAKQTLKSDSLSQAKQEKFPSLHTPYWCIQNCHRKAPLLRGIEANPEKWLSLSWAKREKFPSLHDPYWCIQNCHRKPPLLRGKHSKPQKVTLSLLSEVIEISLTTYPWRERRAK